MRTATQRGYVEGVSVLAPGTTEKNPVGLRLREVVSGERQVLSYTKSQPNKASDADFFFLYICLLLSHNKRSLLVNLVLVNLVLIRPNIEYRLLPVQLHFY